MSPFIQLLRDLFRSRLSLQTEILSTPAPAWRLPKNSSSASSSTRRPGPLGLALPPLAAVAGSAGFRPPFTDEQFVPRPDPDPDHHPKASRCVSSAPTERIERSLRPSSLGFRDPHHAHRSSNPRSGRPTTSHGQLNSTQRQCRTAQSRNISTGRQCRTAQPRNLSTGTPCAWTHRPAKWSPTHRARHHPHGTSIQARVAQHHPRGTLNQTRLAPAHR
jgi:hypothetical protein